MSFNSRDIEERSAEASQAIDDDPTLKATEVAAAFKAPYQRLFARRRGRPASHTRGGHNKKLTTPQDDALKEYILMLQYSGHGANLHEIRAAAERPLYFSNFTTGDSNSSVSVRWTKKWMTRQSDFLKAIREKPLSVK